MTPPNNYVTVQAVFRTGLMGTPADQITTANIGNLKPAEGVRDNAIEELRNLGFDIGSISEFSVSVGSYRLRLEELLQTTLVKRSHVIRTNEGVNPITEYYIPIGEVKIPDSVAEYVEGFVFPEPPDYLSQQSIAHA